MARMQGPDSEISGTQIENETDHESNAHYNQWYDGQPKQQFLIVHTISSLSCFMMYAQYSVRILRIHQLKTPVSPPSSSMSMSIAAGRTGKPGIVIMEPQTATMNPAPEFSLNSRIGRVNPIGAPNSVGS